jgi:hypothetical protein
LACDGAIDGSIRTWGLMNLTRAHGASRLIFLPDPGFFRIPKRWFPGISGIACDIIVSLA